MSKTLLKKPYKSVKEDGTEHIDVTETVTRNPKYRRTYAVKNKLRDEQGNLWGYVIEANGEKKRVDSMTLYTMMMVHNIPVVVDWTGRDAPATLTVQHKKTEDGMIWFFKTLGDKFKKNNLENVPELKSQSSHLRKIGRLSLQDI